MQKRQILLNAISSVIQVVGVGAILFVLYRFLIRTIGIELLGVWSVMLATTSIANIANLGFSSSVVKFVSKYKAKNDDSAVASVIETSVLSLAVLGGIFLLFFYPFSRYLLGLIVPAHSLQAALAFLPYALLSLWITLITGVFQSGLDGYQRVDLRSMLVTGGSLVYLILCFVMVPQFGLMGLAYAQIVNALILLVANWIMLKRCNTLLPILPFGWNRQLFQEMIDYGLKLQAISVSVMLFDPVTKALVTKFGGLAMTGYFEMANRMLAQFRSLLISANQVLVPAIADLQETKPDLIKHIYRDSYRLLVYFALPFYSAVFALIPIISELWIGHYEASFVLFSVLLTVGWLFNTITVPAYFVNMGTGELKWNVVSHVVMGVFNAGLGFSLGRSFGAPAVVAVSAFSLISGGCIVAVSYHRRYNIPILDLFPREDAGLAIGSIIGLVTAALLYHVLLDNAPLVVVAAGILLAYGAVIVVPVWRHPLRSRLLMWFNRYVVASKA